jgi:integrase
VGIKLTRESIAKLIEPGRIFFDSELMGFGYKVHRCADGKIRPSWIVQYRLDGRQRRQKLGDAARLNADAARKKALVWLGKVAEGIDPAAQKDAQRVATALTFSAAVEQYLDLKRLEVRPSSLRLTTLYLTNKRYFGALHSMPLTKITRSDVATALNKITLASGAHTVSRARAHLSAFFVWAMKNGHCDLNPVIATVNPKIGPSRERVLDDRELAAIWKACPDNEYGKIIKLLLFTGCRRSEIGGLKWSEIDLEQDIIALPGERTKNGRAHTLTLPKLAMDIIRSIPQRVDRDFLFGERASGFTRWQTSHLDDGCTPWTLHDLRRTFRTGLGRLGIPPHIAKLCVNHRKGGVEAIYDRYTYDREIRNALHVWADHVAEIVSVASERSSISQVINTPHEP